MTSDYGNCILTPIVPHAIECLYTGAYKSSQGVYVFRSSISLAAVVLSCLLGATLPSEALARGAGHSSHAAKASSVHVKGTGAGRGHRAGSRHAGRAKASGFRSAHTSRFARSRTSRVEAGNDHAVQSYYRKNGTHVQTYMVTNADSTRNDNYGTRGNVNPYTGKAGTKPRDGQR